MFEYKTVTADVVEPTLVKGYMAAKENQMHATKIHPYINII